MDTGGKEKSGENDKANQCEWKHKHSLTFHKPHCPTTVSLCLSVLDNLSKKVMTKRSLRIHENIMYLLLKGLFRQEQKQRPDENNVSPSSYDRLRHTVIIFMVMVSGQCLVQNLTLWIKWKSLCFAEGLQAVNKLTSTSPPSFSINVPFPPGPGCPPPPPLRVPSWTSPCGLSPISGRHSGPLLVQCSSSFFKYFPAKGRRSREGTGKGGQCCRRERCEESFWEKARPIYFCVETTTQPAPSRPSEHNLPTCPKILSKHQVLLLATFWKTCVSQEKKKRARFPRGLECLRARASPASVPPRPSWQTEASDYDSDLEWRGEAAERHNGISAQNPLHSIQWAAHNPIIAPAATITTHNCQNVWNALSSTAAVNSIRHFVYFSKFHVLFVCARFKCANFARTRWERIADQPFKCCFQNL